MKGDQGDQGIQGVKGDQGDQGVPGLSSSVFRYQFQTATTPPPSAGHISPNASTPAATTSIYVAHVDGDGLDVSVILANVQPNSLVTLQKSNDDTIFVRFTTSGLTTNVGWTEFFVTEQSSAGLLQNNMQLVLVVQTAGVQGPPGQDAADPAFTASITSSGPSVIPAVSLTGTYPALNLGFALRDGANATDPVFTASLVASGTGVTPAVVLTGTYPNLNLGFSLQSGAAGAGSSVTVSNTTSTATHRMLFSNATSGTTASTLNTMASGFTILPSTGAISFTGSMTGPLFIGALTGQASTAAQVLCQNSASTNVRYVTFVSTNSTATANDVFTATALTYQPSSQILSVPSINSTTITATTFSGTATSALNVSTSRTTAATVRYLIMSPNDNATATSAQMNTATSLYYTPSTQTLVVNTVNAVTVNGDLSGTASIATQAVCTNSVATTIRYLTFASTNGAATANNLGTCTGVSLIPSSGALTCSTLAASSVTAASLFGVADSAIQVRTIRNAANLSRYILFSPNDNAAATAADVMTATALVYNPSTQVMTIPNIVCAGTITGTVATSTTSTNLAGGAGGSLPYQSAAGTTTFLAISSVAGQMLRTTSTVPTWATPGGFPISFGGNASAAGMVLQYQLPSALFATTTLNSSLGTPGNGFVTPYSCILVAAAAYSTTSSTTATATIHVNGSATALTTIGAGTNFSVTGNRVLVLSASTNTIAAGSLVEVRVNTAAIGNCQITLYIA